MKKDEYNFMVDVLKSVNSKDAPPIMEEVMKQLLSTNVEFSKDTEMDSVFRTIKKSVVDYIYTEKRG
jgi:hypothetical protein